jgi:Protein of unknown function (DUF751)
MNEFWKNIIRYPRFFISSLVGLILVIISPVKNLFKIRRLRIVLLVILLLVLFTLYYILRNMVGL